MDVKPRQSKLPNALLASVISNSPMQFFVGTSGYSYKEWRGIFYPPKLPAKAMLGHYAQHFSAVEMNYTFRMLPSANVVKNWSEQTHANFQFVLKAPQSITHFKRLKDVEEKLEQFLEAAAPLSAQQGPVLFQLPPNFKKDVKRLDDFLAQLAQRVKSAFEFRHESWWDEEVYACLRAHACTMCFADVEEQAECAKLVRTTDWGYVRLRSEGYTDHQLAAWIANLKAHRWKQAYVFFKHEETGTGPKLASRFLEMAGA